MAATQPAPEGGKIKGEAPRTHQLLGGEGRGHILLVGPHQQRHAGQAIVVQQLPRGHKVGGS